MRTSPQKPSLCAHHLCFISTNFPTRKLEEAWVSYNKVSEMLGWKASWLKHRYYDRPFRKVMQQDFTFWFQHWQTAVGYFNISASVAFYMWWDFSVYLCPGLFHTKNYFSIVFRFYGALVFVRNINSMSDINHNGLQIYRHSLLSKNKLNKCIKFTFNNNLLSL